MKIIHYVAAILILIIFPTRSNAQRGTLNVNSGWYAAGTNITIIATPIQYSKFTQWHGNTNNASILNNQITLSVTNSISITAAFSAITTTIGNVPYEWLANWTNSNFELIVTNDWDYDGFSNIQEFWSATNPQNNESFLKITSMQRTNNSCKILWKHQYTHQSITNIQIQYTTNLTSGIWTLAQKIQPVNGTNIWDGDIITNMYYRLISIY